MSKILFKKQETTLLRPQAANCKLPDSITKTSSTQLQTTGQLSLTAPNKYERREKNFS
jgi:hypothetical protein